MQANGSTLPTEEPKVNAEVQEIVVVIDNGSQTMRCGVDNDDESCAPRVMFPCILGRMRFPGVMIGMPNTDSVVGEEAIQKRAVLRALTHPIEEGHITSWDDMEKIWHHTFYKELRVDPTEAGTRTIITTGALTTKDERMKVAETMFETFNTSALFIANRPLVALFASGRTTGVVIHLGGGTSAIVPIHDGCVVEDAVLSLPYTGASITDRLVELLAKRGHAFTTRPERDVITDLKERYAFVAQDFNHETKMAKINPSGVEIVCDADHTDLPSPISIGAERFLCAELLFQPDLHPGSHGALPLPQAVVDAIARCHPALRPDLYTNIVISGGTSELRGLAPRLRGEVARLAPHGAEVHVQALGGDASYRGAHILSSVPEFAHFWVTKEQYDEEDLSALHRLWE